MCRRRRSHGQIHRSVSGTKVSLRIQPQRVHLSVPGYQHHPPTALQTGDAHVQVCLLQRAVETAHGQEHSAITRLLRR
jgi:hypothetical protein